jgi:hypothetical protein
LKSVLAGESFARNAERLFLLEEENSAKIAQNFAILAIRFILCRNFRDVKIASPRLAIFRISVKAVGDSFV